MRQMRSHMTAVGTPGRIISASFIADMVFPHTCDLWKPSALVLNANKSAQDRTFIKQTPPNGATSFRCKFIGTPETDVPSAQGLTKEVNIFTLDHFLFPQGCPILNTWWIKFTGGGDMNNKFWVAQGNAQEQEQNPFHVVHCLLVYGKQGPPPAGIS